MEYFLRNPICLHRVTIPLECLRHSCGMVHKGLNRGLNRFNGLCINKEKKKNIFIILYFYMLSTRESTRKHLFFFITYILFLHLHRNR